MKQPGGDDSYWWQRAVSFSSFYKPGSGISARRAVTRFLDRRTAVLRSMLDRTEGATVLDVGCGSGVHLKELAGSCRSIAGVDYSRQMLELAREELHHVQGSWSLHLADAAALPFADGSFDLLISMGLLDYVASPERVLREFHRVLKRGGTLALSAPKSPSAFFLLRTGPGDRIKKLLFDLPPISNTMRRGELERLVSAGGFELQRIESVWTTMWMVKATKTAAVD